VVAEVQVLQALKFPVVFKVVAAAQVYVLLYLEDLFFMQVAAEALFTEICQDQLLVLAAPAAVLLAVLILLVLALAALPTLAEVVVLNV
jgi:hypothetical protein